MSAIIQGKGDVFGPAGAVAGNIPQFDGATGKIIKDGKVAPAGAVVGTTDTQDLSNKTLLDPLTKVNPTAVPSRVAGMILSQPDSKGCLAAYAVTTAFSISIPGGMMSRVGDLIHVEFGTFYAGNANTKQVTIAFGSVSLLHSHVANNFSYQYTANIWRRAGNQLFIFMVTHSWNGSGGGTQNFSATGTIDFTAAQTLSLVIAGGVVNDTIAIGSFVHWWPCNQIYP